MPSKWGSFDSLAEVEFLADGKRCKVKRQLVYTRPDDRVMVVPVGTISDGASIPKVLWYFADSPFTGNNLRPALIHDYYCQLGRQGLSPYSSTDVHYMFHQGLRLEGESWWRARSKWLFVRYFGPKFEARP